MYQRNLCGPTNRPSDVLSIPATVTVPPGKTVSVPVRVAHAPETSTDVAVRVTQAATGKQSGVGIDVASYAQEILGRGTASGCSVIRGNYAQARTVAPRATASHSASSIPVSDIVIAVLALMVLVLAGRGVWRKRQQPKSRPAHSRR